jgi:class 3 adenylate cyclase/tetratricopeptide (TPR) repeat protein
MGVAARDAAVVAIVGVDGERRIPIEGELTLGRADDVGLVIDDPEISRTHAVITQSAEGIEIRDLSSLNGTWVNGERINTPTALVPGDVVKVGKTRIEVLVADAPAYAPVARASPTPVDAEDELRPVSVLFADVVGSTPLAERLEPGEYAALMGGCVDRMCRAVEQFGGVIDAYMGDGIAAFFGFPAATEDDADRAATAALSVVDAIDKYADEIRQTSKLADLEVRVGVNSGQVAIGVVGIAERHPVALGDTMNVAARLQGTAEPGTIVIGGATARKLGGRFLVAPLGRITVRGRETPVEAWRLLGARNARPMSDAGGLVGREHEQALLLAATERLKGGNGQLVLLSGEAGIGKTRLLEWLREQLGDSVTWLEGRCASYGGQPLYHAPAEALRGWVGVDDVARRSATLERLGLEPNALPYLATLLSPDADSNGASDQFGAELAEAYETWIAGICREGPPVVLAIHDLHWADHGTLDVLERLAGLLDHTPLMLAATSRATPEARDRNFRDRMQLERPDGVVDVALGPLSDAEAGELLAQFTPGELSSDAQREVIGLAEGNPLYLEHLLRSLLESGGLAPRRTWALTVSAAQLPTALESLLIARIAALPRDARRVAQVGSILGRTFAPTVLAEVSGVMDIERNLVQLLRANVISETRTVPNREYSFTHGLLQEAALSTLTRARRRELYRRVAVAYEEAFSDALDEHLEQLAFYRARGGDLERALEYLERAANRAVSLDARTQAARLWSQAAVLAKRMDDPEARDRIEQGIADLRA